ncbi:hypothetical protein ABZZ79_10175 [Streptomyces sp. NPDC006458]
MSYPPYKAPRQQRVAHDGTSPLTFVLLITVPAVIAVAALRAR